MNVESINVWAQLIASIGVIVSLFYVAAQVPAKHALFTRDCGRFPC